MNSNKKKYKIHTRLWRWPGDGGWHFVTIEKKIFNEIRAIYPKGLIRIEVNIGDSIWQTSLLPHTSYGEYLIAIKKSIRNTEGLFDGDMVDISFVIL
ncbi:MAG: hypothetical protein RL687_536 [Candidatus Parcubacteria bacterium]|jgi:hypothetical protein